ncbi:MAG: lysophospholipid acyltransferase family protein [Candidatus Riflebacteria bacterium]|nr:lysophospholipid acyltransferase family protein [Candidatus Riflebacteria bacterium]
MNLFPLIFGKKAKEKFKYYKRLLRFYAVKLLLDLLKKATVPSISKIAHLLMKIMPVIFKHELKRASELLPEEFQGKRSKILHGMIANQANNLLEIIFYENLLAHNPDFITISGIERLEKARKEGRGAILLSAHFGNWELVGYKLAELGFDMNVIARPQAIKQMTELMNEFREKRGVKILMKENLTASLKILKQNGFVGIVSDLNAREKGWQVDFFGRKASFYIAPVLLAMRSKAPIFPTFIERKADGSHFITIQEPLIFSSEEKRSQRVQKYVNRFIEIIRKRPDHWVWFHERYHKAYLGQAE